MSRKDGPAPVVNVLVGQVEVGQRARSHLGDLTPLAENIRELGLLHPIGVDKDNRLLFGERRLRAVRDVLGWDRIPARMLDVDELAAQAAENEQRLDLRPLERQALYLAMQDRLKRPRGRPRSERNRCELAGSAWTHESSAD